MQGSYDMNLKNALGMTILFLAVALGGCAAVPRSPEARLSASAAVADGVSTEVAISAGGAVETNPLVTATPAGLILVTTLKLGLAHSVDQAKDPKTRRFGLNMMSATWGGASVNNLLILAGATPPVAIVAGIGAGIAMWRESDRRITASAPAAPRNAVAADKPAAPTEIAYAKLEYRRPPARRVARGTMAGRHQDPVVIRQRVDPIGLSSD
jgi:hypothetical protein